MQNKRSIKINLSISEYRESQTHLNETISIEPSSIHVGIRLQRVRLQRGKSQKESPSA